MKRKAFEHLVAQALDELPDQVRKHIANVAVVVEDWPDDDTLDMAGIEDPQDLLGFYHGIPLTERTHDYGLVLPDKISLYREPILASCENEGQVPEAIKHTLLHEIAHYFGIDDDRLDELGAY